MEKSSEEFIKTSLDEPQIEFVEELQVSSLKESHMEILEISLEKFLQQEISAAGISRESYPTFLEESQEEIPEQIFA